MKREEVTALLLLAGITPIGITKITNAYWPMHRDYDEYREANPWWAITVEGGDITIGWRKRVISIDWKMTNRRGVVTKDDVTKDDTMVHAWSMGKAVEYLRAWRELPIIDVSTGRLKTYIVEGKIEILKALNVLKDDSSEMKLMEDLVSGAREGWSAVMTVNRSGESGHSFNLRLCDLTIHYYPRERE